MLSNIIKAVDQVVGLNDPQEENRRMVADRTAIGGTNNFVAIDQAAVTTASMGSYQTEVFPANTDIIGTLEQSGEKFHILWQQEWTNTSSAYDKLFGLNPYELLASADYGSGLQLKTHRYYRAGIDVIVQVASTQFHQGCLMIGLVPGWEEGVSYAGLTVCPHGFINLNINTCVRIMAPFVSTRGSIDTRTNMGKVWTILGIVLNKLAIGNNSSPSVTVTVMGRFTNLEQFGLKPVSMMGPTAVRVAPGANVINLSVRQEASASMYLGTARESFVEDAAGGGGMKITSLRTWVETPSHFLTFAFNASSAAGQRIACWNVNPYNYYGKSDSGNSWHITSLATVAQWFVYWRGDIVYKFQYVGTRMHSGKIMICFVPGNETMNLGTLTQLQGANCQAMTFDLQGVASTCNFRVPWTCDVNYRTNRIIKGQATSTAPKHHYSSIGKIVVFCHAKLISPNSQPPHVWFNVFISLENGSFLAPMYENMGPLNYTGTFGVDESAPNTHGEGRAEDGTFTSTGVVDQMPAQTAPPGDGADDAAPLKAATSMEDPGLEREPVQTFAQRDHGQPWCTADNMDIYEIFGRGHFCFSYTLRAGGTRKRKTFTVPLDFRRVENTQKGFGGMLQQFFSLVHLMRGPIDITVVISGDHDVDGITWFTPAGMYTSTPWDQEQSPDGLTVDYVSAYGSVRWNSRFSSSFQIRLPFYSNCYALSGNVDPTHNTDSLFGYLSTSVNNFSDTDDNIGFSFYLSFPRDMSFYVPRPPLRANMVYPSSGVVTYDGLESSVDRPEDEALDDDAVPTASNDSPLAEAAFYPPIAPARSVVDVNMGKVYKEMRMRVGRLRLEYAKEEMRKWKSEEVISKSGMFEDGEVVQWRDASILYRGLCYGDRIWYVACLNHTLRSAPLLKTGAICSEKASNKWLSLNTKVEPEKIAKFVSAVGEGVPLNWAKFEKQEYQASLGTDAWLKLENECEGSLIEILQVFSGKSLGMLDRMLLDSDVLSGVVGTTELVKSVTEECKSLMTDVRKCVNEFASCFPTKKRVFVVKVVSCIVKSALKIYTLQRVGGDTGALVALLADWSLDCVDCVFDVGGLLNGMVGDIVNLLGEDEPEPTTKGDLLRDLVAGISVFKSAKQCFEWVFSKIQHWYEANYGERRVILQELKDNAERIEALISYADQFCSKPLLKEEDYNDGVVLLKEVRTVMSLMEQEPTLRSKMNDLRQLVGNIHGKLRMNPTQSVEAPVRHEPIVVYLHGERGQGKSLLALALAVKLCKAHGFDPKKNIYAKPGDAQFWDGYQGQFVVMMDDVGQDTNDEDWRNFCQLVSCCPYRVNMAGIDQKGQHFYSPFIICTSNLSRPDPKTVYCADAVLRRLHLKYRVEAKEYYTTVSDGFRVLDTKRAKLDGALDDMSCVRVVSDGGVEMTLDLLVDACRSKLSSRKELAEEMFQIWARSGNGGLAEVLTKSCGAPSSLGKALLTELLTNKVVILGSIVGLLGTAGLIYGITKLLQKPNSSAAYSVAPVRRPTIVRLGETIVTQSMVDLTSLVNKALCRFGVSYDGTTVTWVLNGLRICETWVMLPAHGIRYQKDVKSLWFLIGEVTYVSDLDRVTMIEPDQQTDIVFMNVPGIPKARDIRSHFVKRADLGLCNHVPATLATSQRGVFQLIPEGDVVKKDCVTYVHKRDGEDSIHIVVPEIWEGRGESSPGSCGGVLISASNRVGNPFIGIHVASGHNKMYSVVVTQEMLRSLDGVIATSRRIHNVSIDKPLHTNAGSSYQRSPLYDTLPWPVQRSPAAMFRDNRSDIDVVSTMIAKYNTPLVEEPVDFEVAASQVFEWLCSSLGQPEFRPLSVSEALLGIPDLDAVDMQTSPGLPYVERSLRKTDLVEHGQIIHPLLKERHTSCVQHLVMGYGPPVQFLSCFKDELRDTEKVVTGKTRVIECAPFDLTIALRQLWGNVIAKIHRNHGWDIHIAVGMDVDSEWSEFVKEALRFGDQALSLDYSGFDASIQPFMIARAIKMIGELSGLYEPTIRGTVAVFDVVVHRLGSLKFVTRGSLPSGMAATSIINSLINMTLIVYVFSKAIGVRPMDLRDCIKFVVYGDDVLIVWSRRLPLLPDLGVIQRLFAILGMVVTGGDKGLIRYEPLLKLVFLKRGVKVGKYGLFHPCMSEVTMRSMLQWKRKGSKFQDVVDDACWFAYHHGERFYEEFTHVVRVAAMRAGFRLTIPSFEVLEQRYLQLVYW